MPVDLPNLPEVVHLKQFETTKRAPGLKIAKKDFFADLDELKSEFKQGKDYEIRLLDRKSKVTIVAPHGGGIEAGTSELAHAVSGDKYNLFDFCALSFDARTKGHVTSTHFRDPQLSKLIDQSTICVSLHRMRDEHSTLYLGGKNDQLKIFAAKELSKQGFKSTVNPPRLKGRSLNNFVNMAQEAGLQIEIPKTLANQLIPGVDRIYRTKNDYQLNKNQNKRFKNFVQAIDKAIQEYMSKRK